LGWWPAGRLGEVAQKPRNICMFEGDPEVVADFDSEGFDGVDDL
jgi:hypothetical protein